MADIYYSPTDSNFTNEDIRKNLCLRYENTTPFTFKLPIFMEEEEAKSYGKKYGLKNPIIIQIAKTTTKRAIIHIKREELKGFFPITFFKDDFIEKCCEVYE